MKFLKYALAKYKVFQAYLTVFLAHFGVWGPCAMSGADAIIPVVPMDPIMAAYVWVARDHVGLVIFYCVTAAISSALGSLVPYWIGRGGGELLLLKRIDRHRMETLRDKFENQEFFFLLIPSMLPPPTPFKLIVLTTGVFEMKVPLFLLAIFLGRLLRFGIVAFLTIRFGQAIVDIVTNAVRQHLPVIFLVLGSALVGYFIWWMRKRKNRALVAEL